MIKKLIRKYKEWKFEKEYLQEIKDNYVKYKYQVMKIQDEINNYKLRGKNAYTTLKDISNIL